jgi:hypothetical protein
MAVKSKKYRVSVSFCRKLVIFGKTVSEHLWILSENFKNFKTHKNSYMRPLCITDSEYVGYDQEMRSFGQFLPQTGDL